MRQPFEREVIMARITLDLFSGRPNPTWVLDDAKARDVLRRVRSRPELAAPVDAYPAILGYRGVVVELEHDGAEAPREFASAVPAAFRLGSGKARDNGGSFELAEQLVDQMTGAAPAGGHRDLGPSYVEMDLGAMVKRMMSEAASSPEFSRAPTDHETYRTMLRERASEQHEEGEEHELETESVEAALDPAMDREIKLAAQCWNPAPVKGTDATSWVTQAVGACSVELAYFNPAFWNTSSVQPYNNCYNYGTNRRTDTFAQPGRATCAGTSTMQCANVTAGARSDGGLTVPTCAPAGEAPRWYMALVVAPGYDYHWYRKARNGFWGHKPGSTAAKNTDNNGVVITNPQTCARAPYTNFCGYWFARRGMGIR
jgi:hypothetical protein